MNYLNIVFFFYIQALAIIYKPKYMPTKLKFTNSLNLPESEVLWADDNTTLPDLDVTDIKIHCIWVFKVGCYNPYRFSYMWGSFERVSDFINCNNTRSCQLQEEWPSSMIPTGLARLTTTEHLLKIIPKKLKIDLNTPQAYSKLPTITTKKSGAAFMWFIPLGLELKFIINPRYNDQSNYPKLYKITIPLLTKAGNLNGVYGVMRVCTGQGQKVLKATDKRNFKQMEYVKNMYCPNHQRT